MSIYTILFIAILGLGYFTTKNNKYYNIAYIILIFSFFALISGLRYSNVGTDTKAYINIYNNINSLGGYLNNEFGFKSIIFWLRQYKTAQSFFVFSSAITFGIFAFFSAKYSKQSFLTVSILFLFWTLGLQMNITRQYIAISLYLLLFYSLEKKQYLATLLLIPLTISFHNTAIILIPIILVPFIIKPNLKIIRYLFFAIPIVILAFKPLIFLLFKIVPRYSHYTSSEFMASAKFVNFPFYIVGGICISIAYTYVHFKNNTNRRIWYKYIFNEETQIDTRLLLLFTYFTLWLIIFETLSLQAYIINRVSYYFIPFLSILLSYLPKMLKKKPLIIILGIIFIVAILNYITWYSMNLCDIRPYHLFTYNP